MNHTVHPQSLDGTSEPQVPGVAKHLGCYNQRRGGGFWMIKKCPFQGHLIFLRGCHFILSLPYSGEIAFMEETLPFCFEIFFSLSLFIRIS